MALTAANVRVGVTGGVYFAASSVNLPTDGSSTLSSDWTDVGYVSDEGVTQSIAQDITDISAWQNGDVVRKVQTSHDLTYAFTMIETSEATLEAFYGNYTNGTVEITGEQLPRQRMVLDVVDGGNIVRLCLPDAQITERGDVVFQNAEAVGYPVTVTAFPDTDGVKAYMYLVEPVSS